jgi:general secretion pathway protein B
MSFILDALKKSEDERLRQAGPSLADAPASRRRTDRPWWAIAVAALLLVNIAVLIVVLTRNNGAANANVSQPASASVPAPISFSPPPAETSPTTLTAPLTPVVQSSKPALEQPGDATFPATPILGPSVAPADVSAAADQLPQTPPAAVVQPAVSQPPANQGPLPTANQIASKGVVPPLHLDLHVYADAPSGRFVFINNRKYQQGQTIAEGPRVEEITPDGVILSNQGQRFVLPRD